MTQYNVNIYTIPMRHLAVARRRVQWDELGSHLISLLDRVYIQVHAGNVIQSGQNVFVYRDATKEGVTVEIGVEVSGPFEAVEDVIYASTPTGEVASVLHVGPYTDLRKAYDALIQWCEELQRPRANVYWEVYGDWKEDPTKERGLNNLGMLPGGRAEK